MGGKGTGGAAGSIPKPRAGHKPVHSNISAIFCKGQFAEFQRKIHKENANAAAGIRGLPLFRVPDGRAGLSLYSVLLSLSCVLIFSASDSAPIFFFVLPKKKTVARRRKLCIARFHAGVKTYSRRCVSFPPHKRCAGLCGGFWASSEGLCAPPDAQPLTLAVCAAWRCHWRFHIVRLNGERLKIF